MLKTLNKLLHKTKLLILGKTGRSIIFVYATDILSKIFAVIVAVMTIRVLTKSHYGIYTIILSISTFVAAVVGDGLNMSLVRILARKRLKNSREVDCLIKSNFILQMLQTLFMLGLIIIFAKKLSYFFFGDRVFYKWIIVGASASLGIILIKFSMTLSRAFENFKRYGMLNNFKVFVVLVAYLLLFQFKMLNLQSIAAILIIVPLSYGVYILNKEGAFRNLLESFNLHKITSYFKSEIYLIAFYYILALFSQINVFVVARYKSVEELAIFGVAQKYYFFLILLLSSISTVLVPKVAKMAEDKNRLKAFLRKWLRISSGSIIPFLIILLFSPAVLNYLNNYKYPQANLLFQILCISAWFSLGFSPLTGILVSLKKYRFLALSAAVLQSINLMCSIWAINMYGILGVVIVFTVMNILGHLWSFRKTMSCFDVG